ncbi:25712_t:CDS:2 [Gigaspora rosea]|nr:25712_t:CDS:2 [Gigaspora rosea]
MPIANVHISKGSKTLHGWYAHPIPYEMSIKEFFDKLIIGEISPDCDISVSPFKTIDHIELSQTLVAGATTIQASPHCQIIESTKAFGLNIHYCLNTSDMITSHLAPLNNKQVLYNDIIEWIRQNGGGWSSIENANAQGKRFISCLGDIIWYIYMHNYLKLKERSYHIPELFMGFFGHANPESYKNSRKPFNAIELNLHCQALALHTTSYFLNGQNKITAKNHASITPVRKIEQAITIKIHKANTYIMPNDEFKYNRLENALEDLPLWIPIDIENYLPIDPVPRMRYIQGLSRAFTFKLGADETMMMQRNTNIVNELQAYSPHYHTRAMRKNYFCT